MPGNSLVRLAISVFLFAVPALSASRGFRTQDLLQDHYRKYSHEFGRITQVQYLHLAQQLRDARPGKNTLEARRPDGGGSKFDRRRGWFVAYDADGTIRTFFVPNEGVRYFDRQAQSHGPPE